MLAQRRDCNEYVPEFKLNRQNSESTLAKQIQVDYKLGKLRRFKSSKIKVKSPKIKSRNKDILLNDYKSGPINPKLLKIKLPISIDRNISNINKDKIQFCMNFQTIKNSENLHDFDQKQKRNPILKLTKKLNSNPNILTGKGDMPVSKVMKSKDKSKKSLKGFATENAMKINQIKYGNENNNVMLHQMAPLNDIDFHKVNEPIGNESILHRHATQAWNIK